MARKDSFLVKGFAWVVLSGLVMVTAIAFLSTRWGWPLYLELLSHFQRQYWLLSLMGLAAIALTRCRWPSRLAWVCAAALTAHLLTWYLPPHFLTVDEPGDFRVLISNVNAQNRDFQAVLAFAEQANPDLALFMEVDRQWVEQLNNLLPTLPYSVHEAKTNNFGLAMYSRSPLTDVELVNFATESSPSIRATTSILGQSLTLVGTHPLPPVTPIGFRSRNQQLTKLSQYLQAITGPTVVMGDLNITMWSPYYRQFQQQTGLKNVRDGFGILPTWPTGKLYLPFPAWVTQFLTIPIDHSLASSELTVTNVQIGPDIGSDHYPVVVDFRLQKTETG